ncbi:hypothetical protein CEQ31_026700 [Serratia odorifera]|nr:hypothetical protein CEQ31_026700 [Serratia odorifera]
MVGEVVALHPVIVLAAGQDLDVIFIGIQLEKGCSPPTRAQFVGEGGPISATAGMFSSASNTEINTGRAGCHAVQQRLNDPAR